MYRSKLQLYMAVLDKAGRVETRTRIMRMSGLDYTRDSGIFQNFLDLRFLVLCDQKDPRVLGSYISRRHNAEELYERSEKGTELLDWYNKFLAPFDTRESTMRILEAGHDPINILKLMAKANVSHSILSKKLDYLVENDFMKRNNGKGGSIECITTKKGLDLLEKYNEIKEIIKL